MVLVIYCVAEVKLKNYDKNKTNNINMCNSSNFTAPNNQSKLSQIVILQNNNFLT